ncbi:uncharacterized protein LOC143141129 [Alosa pseudoharengus]|uniref:uncharacterized protein LOC143141129 n=1 Tax=Alosa pseudoharengus TaxID=34774 RepID=UPI003F88ED76
MLQGAGSDGCGDALPALGGQRDGGEAGYLPLAQSLRRRSADRGPLQAGAVLAYNRQDLDLLIAAVRARDSSIMEAVSDKDVVRRYISREQLKHHVRRVTLGAHEMFCLIHLNVQSDELLGLEYLFRQSTGESEAFSLDGLVNDGPAPEEVYQPGEDDPGAEADEAYQSDEDLEDIDAARITLTNNETATVHPPAFEDACSANPLPGFQELEAFCATLVQLGGADQKLQLTTDQRNAILDA